MKNRQHLIRVLAVLIGTVLVLYLGRMFTEVLLAAIVAGILYYLAEPMTAFLERWRVPRFVAILAVFVFFLAAIAFLLVIIIPVVVNQAIALAQDVPVVFNQLEEWFRGLETKFGAQIGEEQFQDLVNRAAGTVSDFIETAVASILGILANVLSVILVVVAGVMIAFFLLQDHEGVNRYLMRYVPEESRQRVERTAVGANKVLSGFLKGRVIVGLIVGTAAGLSLVIIGVPYAFIIGVITAVFELIPYIGPILAAIPAILIALTVSPTAALIVAIVYFVIQQFEGIVLSPKVVGAHVKLHPVSVILAVLVGKEILGVLGVFAAIPLVGVAKVVAEEYLLSDEDQKEAVEQREEEQAE